MEKEREGRIEYVEKGKEGGRKREKGKREYSKTAAAYLVEFDQP